MIKRMFRRVGNHARRSKPVGFYGGGSGKDQG
jgi:hypothetical protein